MLSLSHFHLSTFTLLPSHFYFHTLTYVDNPGAVCSAQGKPGWKILASLMEYPTPPPVMITFSFSLVV